MSNRRVSLDDDREALVVTDPLQRQVRDFWVQSIRESEFRLTSKAEYGNTPLLCWDGGVSTVSGRRYVPAWARLLAMAEKHNASPFDMIRVALRGHKGVEPPQPNQVITDRVAEQACLEHHRTDRFRQILEVTKATIDRRFHEHRLNLAYTGDAARMTAVLMNREYDISPLARYCTGWRLSLPSVVTRWFIPALRQYLPDRELYDNVWGAEIPPELRVLTRAAMAQTIEGATSARP